MSFRRVDVGTRVRVKRPAQDRPELAWVSVADLIIDDRYQRDIGKRGWRSIERIARHFDWARFTPILVAPHGDGTFAVVDGQHRSHAAMLIGEDKVPAMVVAMSATDQAAAFAWVNGNVTNVTIFHLYKAALAAGDDWAHACRDAIEAAGCQLMTYNKSAREKKPREVYAIGLIRQLVESGGADRVTRGLNAIVLSEVGGGDAEHYTNAVLKPWFAAIASDPAFARLDLAGFCRKHDLSRVHDRVGALRKEGEYRGISNHVLMQRSLVALLRSFAGTKGVTALPPKAPSLTDESAIAIGMADLAKQENARFRRLNVGAGVSEAPKARI